MKHIVLVLCLLVIGCSPKGGPEQTLRMKDGREIECRLLSVRPNGLVVDTLVTQPFSLQTIRPVVFGFDSIHSFHHDPVSMSRTAGVGVGLGILGSFIVGGITSNSQPSQGQTIEEVTDYMTLFGVGVLSGVVTGIGIALLNQHSYDPQVPDDKEQIIKLAIYKTEEPDALKKIQ
jgi:hypothetical protein